MSIDASFGSNTALTVTNLQSLADEGYWQSATIDNGTVKGTWMEIFLTIVTTTTAGDANGAVIVFLAGSTDGGTDFAGGATGSEGTFADTANLDHRHMRRVGMRSCDASETTARTYKYHFLVKDLPEDFTLVVKNESGTTLASSGCACEYRLNKHTST